MKKIFKLILLSAVLGSCQKGLIEKDPENNPVNNFDYLWNQLKQKYALFEFKNVNWDEVYERYRPRVHNEMSDYRLFSVMDSMLFELRDGHTNLTSPWNRSRNWEWYLNSPPNFNYDVIERNYLGNKYWIIGPLSITVIDSIGYLYYGSFSSRVSDAQMQYALNGFGKVKGIIIDVRHNTGGSTENIDVIASRFTDNKVHTCSWIYKTGPGPNDFSAPEKKYIEPAKAGKRFTGPVVVLTNRKCYSATNDFVLTMKALPNVTIIGDTTGGGGGLPFNGELPNGWQFRFSSSQTLAPDGFNVESGIAPDIRVDIKPADQAKGIDSIIEAALEFLK